jgi:hypothetical protein
MLNKPLIDLVELVPIEYHKGRHEVQASGMVTWHNPRIIRYRDISFNSRLTQKDLEKIIGKTNVRKKVSVKKNRNRYLLYQYGNKPTIILDVVKRKIFTTKETLEKHGESTCQQQASILMRLLKEHKHVSFRRVSVTANPDRIGYTNEDRDITFNALHHLFGDYSRKEK